MARRKRPNASSNIDALGNAKPARRGFSVGTCCLLLWFPGVHFEWREENAAW
jgi:hypothetical protein